MCPFPVFPLNLFNITSQTLHRRICLFMFSECILCCIIIKCHWIVCSRLNINRIVNPGKEIKNKIKELLNIFHFMFHLTIILNQKCRDHEYFCWYFYEIACLYITTKKSWKIFLLPNLFCLEYIFYWNIFNNINYMILLKEMES